MSLKYEYSCSGKVRPTLLFPFTFWTKRLFAFVDHSGIDHLHHWGAMCRWPEAPYLSGQIGVGCRLLPKEPFSGWSIITCIVLTPSHPLQSTTGAGEPCGAWGPWHCSASPSHYKHLYLYTFHLLCSHLWHCTNASRLLQLLGLRDIFNIPSTNVI